MKLIEIYIIDVDDFIFIWVFDIEINLNGDESQ